MNDKVTIRTYKPGDPSMVCLFHYKIYEKQYHFNGMYEKEMLSGMAELYNDLDGSQMWIAEYNSKIVGTVAVIKRGNDRAQIRWFGVDASMRGQRLGQKLFEIAMNFCKEKGYIYLSLGTLDILKTARHIYAKFGFHKTESEFYNEWDESRDMYHETWECELE